MNIQTNKIYYPEKQWLNPFDSNNEFDISLNPDFFSKIIDEQNNLIDRLYDKKKIFIKYCYFAYIKKFIENEVFQTLINKFVNNDLKIVLVGDDVSFLRDDDVDYIEKNDWFFKNKNLLFYQVTYITTKKEFEQNLYIGVFVHYLLRHLLHQSEYNHFEQNHEKVFLSLNNRERKYRTKLYNLYEKLNNTEKDKLLVSFNFKNIFLEKELFPGNSGEANYEHSSLYTSDILKFYKKCMFEIVSETMENLITEKTYKPLLCGVPFIIYNEKTDDIINSYKNLGIDINYFGIDYSDIENVNQFIKSILSEDTNLLKQKYKLAFIQAEENKVKLHQHFLNVKEKIEKL